MVKTFGLPAVITMIALGIWGAFVIGENIGFNIGYKNRYEYNHRINPTEITINQQTGDTTFVYIMK